MAKRWTTKRQDRACRALDRVLYVLNEMDADPPPLWHEAKAARAAAVEAIIASIHAEAQEQREARINRIVARGRG